MDPQDIREAAERIEREAVRTPLLHAPALSAALGAEVYVKPESLQRTGSFKFRGAYNRLAQLDAEERKRGVVAFSSGNHAQGVACAARLLRIKATIVMPSDAPRVKLDGTRALGASVRLYERHVESRERIAAEIAEDAGAVLVPAFDDPRIIAGQGTCGLELMQDLAAYGLNPDRVLAPCGGGGLLAGVSTAVKDMLSHTKVYGVEPERFDDHARSKRAGRRVRVDGAAPTLCDALMASTPGELTWSVNRRTVDDFLVVTEDEVMRAVSYAFRHMKLVLEPGGAVALAALLAGKAETADGEVVAAVLSGGNIDGGIFARCLAAHPEP